MKALIAIGLLWAGLAAADGAGPAELAAEALILESGEAELSAEEYLAGHARHDHEFLKSATIERKHRRSQASGDLAWVATVATLKVLKDGRPLTISSTESMVLRRGAEGWKIVHIHWSSHAAREGSG